MSLQEILDELPTLQVEELAELKANIAKLESGPGEPTVGGAAEAAVKTHRGLWQGALAKIVGKAVDLPSDAAAQHDHYLYGTPKR